MDGASVRLSVRRRLRNDFSSGEISRRRGRPFAVGDQDTVVDSWYWSVGNGFRMHEEHSNYGQLVRRRETKTSIRQVAESDGRKLLLASQLEPEGYNREHFLIRTCSILEATWVILCDDFSACKNQGNKGNPSMCSFCQRPWRERQHVHTCNLESWILGYSAMGRHCCLFFLQMVVNDKHSRGFTHTLRRTHSLNLIHQVSLFPVLPRHPHNTTRKPCPAITTMFK